MSRCFPFPPPGYEKKSRADDENLLKKEKQKEKKHKKEKKDKEKREGKEKKDKERSEEKHREKKDRKEKHKEKKDKHKDKERKNVSVEKDTVRPPEHGSVEKLRPCPVQSSETSESRFLLELGKRIGNSDERAAEKNLLVQKFTLTGKKNTEMPGKETGEDRRMVNGHHNGVGVANGFIQKFEGGHQKTIEGVGGLVEKSAEKQTKEEINKPNNGESGGGKHKEKDQEKIIGVDGLVENSVKKRTEPEEINKQKNGENRGGKHKERDRGKKSKSKDKKREKEKEKAEKKEKKEKELKKTQLKQRETEKSAADGDGMKTTSDISKEKCGGAGNIGKRKELETNGFLLDSCTPPSKLPRHVSSTDQIVENGRRPESCKTAIRFVADGDGNKNKFPRPVSSTDQIVENGRRPESCKTAIRFVADVEGNKKLSSLSISGNGKILESCPRPVWPTNQTMVNGRKPEHSKTAILILAESGEGNKVSSCLPAAIDEKIMEPYPRPKPVVSTNQIVDNGNKLEPDKGAVHVVAEGEGNCSMVSSYLSIAGNGRKMEPQPFSQSILKNGRKLEPCRGADQSTSIINHKVDDKNIIKVNGKEAAQQSCVTLKRPSPSSKQVKEKVKPKLPHPDCKYLSSILSVPQVEWSDFDDQEWLFGGSDLQQAKRPKLGSSQVEGTTKQVWAEAIHVESADVIALPYVIPY